MKSPIGIAATIAAFSLSAACASSGAATTKEPAVTPPSILAAPQLTAQDLTISSRAGIDVQAEVWIDPAGKADLRTLKVTGRGAAENEEAIRRWLSAATFNPALQGGAPVRGLYKRLFSAHYRVR